MVKVDEYDTLVAESYNKGLEPGRILILKSDHYWKVKLKVHNDSVNKLEKVKKIDYVRPTLVLNSVDRNVDNKVKMSLKKFLWIVTFVLRV